MDLVDLLVTKNKIVFKVNVVSVTVIGGNELTTRVQILRKDVCFPSCPWKSHKFAGACSVMVSVIGNGRGDTSSNPGRDQLHFT